MHGEGKLGEPAADRARLAKVSVRCVYAPGIREVTDARIERAWT